MSIDFIFEPFSSGHHAYYERLLFAERRRVSKRVVTLSSVTPNDGLIIWILSLAVNKVVSGRSFWECGRFTRKIFLPFFVVILVIISARGKINLFVPCFDYFVNLARFLRFFNLHRLYVILVAPQLLNSGDIAWLEACKRKGSRISMLKLYHRSSKFFEFFDPIESSFFSLDRQPQSLQASAARVRLLLIGSIDDRKSVAGFLGFARGIGGADLDIVGQWNVSDPTGLELLLDEYSRDFSGVTVNVRKVRYTLEEELYFYGRADYVWVAYRGHHGSSGVVLRALIAGCCLLYDEGLEIIAYAERFPDSFVHISSGMKGLSLSKRLLPDLRAVLEPHHEKNVRFFG